VRDSSHRLIDFVNYSGYTSGAVLSLRPVPNRYLLLSLKSYRLRQIHFCTVSLKYYVVGEPSQARSPWTETGGNHLMRFSDYTVDAKEPPIRAPGASGASPEL